MLLLRPEITGILIHELKYVGRPRKEFNENDLYNPVIGTALL